MSIILRILLCTISLAITVYCQGAGGSSSGGGGGGGGSGGSYGGSSNLYGGSGGSSCTDEDCKRRAGIIAGSIIGGLFGLVLLGFVTYFGFKFCKGRPLRPNFMYTNLALSKKNQQNIYSLDVFQSGTWLGRYYQYTNWHGPYRLSLTFDSESSRVTGSGSDNIGTFTVNGTYSKRTSRIGLKKRYKSGTGDRSENFGHLVTIQLIWNPENQRFEGKWYVHTSRYQGVNQFTLEYQKQPDLPINEH